MLWLPIIVAAISTLCATVMCITLLKVVHNRGIVSKRMSWMCIGALVLGGVVAILSSGYDITGIFFKLWGIFSIVLARVLWLTVKKRVNKLAPTITPEQ